MAIARTISYAFDASTAAMSRGLQPGISALERMGEEASDLERDLRLIPNNVDVDVDVDLKGDSIALLKARLRRQLSDLNERIRIDPDVDAGQALRELRAVERQLRQLDRMNVDVDVDVDKEGLGTLSRFAQQMPKLVSTLTSGGPQVTAALAGIAGAAAAAFGPAALGGAVAVIGGAGGYGLLSAYADLEAQASKVDNVFGRQADEIRAWADTIDTRVGASTQEISFLAAGIGDILTPEGYSPGDASAYAQELFEVGAALAQSDARPLAEGIDAVTSAILGEREQIKGFGTVIDEAMVTARVATKEAAGELDGYSDRQKKIEATFELIKEKSGNALQGFNEGAGDATALVKGLETTFKSLRDNAIAGFGEQFVSALQDIAGAATGLQELDNAPTALSDWIDANESKIKNFFFDLTDVVLVSADAFLKLVETSIQVGETIALSIGPIADILQPLLIAQGLLAKIFAPPTAGAYFDAADAIGEMGDAAEKTAEEIAGWAPGVQDGVDSIEDFIAKGREAAEIAQFKQALVLDIEAGNVDEVERELVTLSRERLVDIQSAIDDGTKNAAERQLEDLARRREAEILAATLGIPVSDKELDDLARDRDANVFTKLFGYAEAEQKLNELARARTVTLTLNAFFNGPAGLVDLLQGLTTDVTEFNVDGRVSLIGGNVSDEAVRQLFTGVVGEDLLDFTLTGTVDLNYKATAWRTFDKAVASLQSQLDGLPRSANAAGKALDKIGDAKPKDLEFKWVKRIIASLTTAGVQAKAFNKVLGISKADLADLAADNGFDSLRKALGYTRKEWKELSNDLKSSRSVLKELKKDADGIGDRIDTKIGNKQAKLEAQRERAENRRAEIESLLDFVLSAAEDIRGEFDSIMSGVADGIVSGLDAVGALSEVESAYQRVIQKRDSYIKDDAELSRKRDAYIKSAEELSRLNSRQLLEYQQGLAKVNEEYQTDLTKYRQDLAALNNDINNFDFSKAQAEAEKWRESMDPAQIAAGWKTVLAQQSQDAQEFALRLEFLRRSVIGTGQSETFAATLVADLAAKGPEAAGGLVKAIADGINNGDNSLLAALTDQFKQVEKLGENFVDTEGFQRGIYKSVLEGMKKAKNKTELYYKRFPLQVTADLVLSDKQRKRLRVLNESNNGRRSAQQIVVQGNMVDPAGAADAIRRVLQDQDAREGRWSW